MSLHEFQQRRRSCHATLEGVSAGRKSASTASYLRPFGWSRLHAVDDVEGVSYSPSTCKPKGPLNTAAKITSQQTKPKRDVVPVA